MNQRTAPLRNIYAEHLYIFNVNKKSRKVVSIIHRRKQIIRYGCLQIFS